MDKKLIIQYPAIYLNQIFSPILFDFPLSFLRPSVPPWRGLFLFFTYKANPAPCKGNTYTGRHNESAQRKAQ